REGEIITLTTHNYRADGINREELDKLETKSYCFRAGIEGNFPPNLHPLPESLELKEGAQVMFIRNDSEGGRFFNGKLATVKKLEKNEIRVSMEGDTDFKLQKHSWQNIRYVVNGETKELEEEVAGTFTQYPVKLAWAITVHKS